MMSESFTALSRSALVFAYSSAKRYAHTAIATEHILLGICLCGTGTAYSALFCEGVSEKALTEGLLAVFGGEKPGNLPMSLSKNAGAVIENAAAGAEAAGGLITDALLLGSILAFPDCGACRLLDRCGADRERLRLRLNSSGIPGKSPEGLKTLLKYGADMTLAAKCGEYDPVYGRDGETDYVMQLLCRRRNANPVLLGQPGVGKTAIVEQIARKIAENRAYPALSGKRLFSLDISSVVAGTKYRGEFEDKLGKIIAEVKNAGNIILFVDELHTLAGAGAAEGAVDAANILKPHLARGEIKLIGATTEAEYKKSIRRDGALARRFKPVMIEPPDREKTLLILKELRPRYEGFHKVSISDGALNAAVAFSEKYLPERAFPDKAIDLLDDGAALCAAEGKRETKSAHIAQSLSRKCKIAVSEITEDEKTRLSGLCGRLKKQVVGQDKAIDALCEAVVCGRVLGARERPLGSFLFCGESGVGKTKLAKALARELLGTESALLYFDMTEYGEKHSASRLIGAPPGYAGFGDGGTLTEAVRRRPNAVILFDEAEKAHPDVLNLLLRVLEDGKLEDSEGETADFRSSIIIFTANIPKNRAISGFSQKQDDKKAEIAKLFRPELVNRFDEIIVFEPLDREKLEKIAENELYFAREHLKNCGMVLQWDKKILSCLAENSGGARALRREIEKTVLYPACKRLVSGENCPNVRLSAENGKIVLN